VYWREFLRHSLIEIVAESKSIGDVVVYGTSDDLLNPGEVLLTALVAEHLGASPAFFHYPKGSGWLEKEIELFEPYKPLPLNPQQAIEACGFDGMPVFQLQEMPSASLRSVSLKHICELILARRYKTNFRVLTLSSSERVSFGTVRCQSFLGLTLHEALGDPEIKLGGAIIYFIYGAYLAETGKVGVVPRKQFGDVLGAFLAGAEYVGSRAKIFPAGEIEILTQNQWKAVEKATGVGKNEWRKAPAWVVRRLLAHPALMGVRLRLLAGEYCPVNYDPERDSFSLWEPQLVRYEGKHR